MASINHFAVADVLSTQVVSHDGSSIIVEAGNFTPMRWFLERAGADKTETDDDIKPPKKKRRIDHDHNHGTRRQVYAPKEADQGEIPIHRATLDLHFPETLTNTHVKRKTDAIGVNHTEWGPEVEVTLQRIEDSRDGPNLKLAILDPRGKGAVLQLATDDITKSTREAVNRLLQHDNKRLDRGIHRFTYRVTTLRCTLKRSVRPDCNNVRLDVSIIWPSGKSAFENGVPVGARKVYFDYDLLSLAFPDAARGEVDHTRSWSPQDFYNSIHVPEKSIDTKELYNDVLYNDLYPFQRRAVSWLLQREGVTQSDGQIRRLSSSETSSARLNLFTEFHDVNGQPCYVNFLQGIVSRRRPDCTGVSRILGGLLAEEMGLGKTVELMALIALHKRPGDKPVQVHDDYSSASVTTSRATLVITPASILQQWKSELARHAPALKVYQYDGIPSVRGKKADDSSSILSALTEDYDVVLTTYQTLTRELHFAEDPPERDMRHARRFERKQSPLVQIEWWRICLDEAQMVESGVSAAARVACRLPRVNSWAVTGTPLRKNIEDILGLLVFLRYKPFSDDSRLWSHLVTNHRHLFGQIFGDIAMRHTKAHVREELRLPPQKRIVITVPFSAVEQQNYTTLFAEMCEDIGLHNDGSPKSDEWDPPNPDTVEAMRTWLVRLRQTCLHSQVGQRNRKALGRGNGPLRTVAEVLEVMVEQNESKTRTEERALLQAQMLRGHILANNSLDENRSEKALKIYEAAMQTSAVLVADASKRLSLAKAKMAAERGTDETEDEESSHEKASVLGPLYINLRTVLQLQHVATFFTATAQYQIKSNPKLTEPESGRFKDLEERETTLYEQAKQMRREMLKETSKKAERLINVIRTRSTEGTLVQMPKIKDLTGVGGIENRRIIEKADELFDVIRAQTKTIKQWRSTMAEYLTKPLVDEDEGKEITGDEYEDSTKQQDELYVYFDAVKAMQADLNTFITGEDAPLIDFEVKTLIRDAKSFLDPDYEFNGVVHAPELVLELLAIRNTFRARKEDVGSVRGLIQETRALQHSMEWQGGARADVERSLVESHLEALNKIFTAYTKAFSGLDKEIDLFRSTQNQRLEFYRQLQELSDAVAPYKEELDDELDLPALEITMAREEYYAGTLAQLRTKHRFLLHLRDESENKDSQRLCVICQSNFENGVLTVCGHQYCKECIHHWWSQHRTCPVCKKKLATRDFHNVTYKPSELVGKEEVASQNGPASPSGSSVPGSPSSQTSIYSEVDPKVLDEIKSIDLPASYGTKIDTLGRHLLWIREHDPGAKSIVFSQYKEFLDVLGTALSEFKIGYSRLGRNGAVERFRHDPSIDCLLLDAKTDSSGLTLVNAQNVFLTEPLLQTAVELQAIARVHRIGQTQPTTVWGYLVNDTVEEAIYELSVARRLAHVQSRQQLTSRKGKSRSTTPGPGLLQETAIDAANSEELQSAPLSKLLVGGKGGGEVVGNEDLWQCLFGKTAQKRNAGTVAATVQPSVELENEVGRHLRGEAAEQRRRACQPAASST